MRGVYIGRFQPFHNGHMDVIKHAFSNGIDNILIGIGSAQYNHKYKYHSRKWKENPFTYAEREKMIQLALGDRFQYEIVPIEDVHDMDYWVERVSKMMRPDDVFITNTASEIKAFEDRGYQIMNFPVTRPIHATDIREMIMLDQSLDEVIHQDVKGFLKYIGAQERMLTLSHLDSSGKSGVQPEQPAIATDCIVEIMEDGKYKGIVIGKRKYPPYGWCIPGGKLDPGLTLKENAKKEMEEELQQKVEIIDMLGIYDDPNRDPRKHRLSVTFIGRSEGTPKASDDLKDAKIFDVHDIPKDLAFDHDKILHDYLIWLDKHKR